MRTPVESESGARSQDDKTDLRDQRTPPSHSSGRGHAVSVGLNSFFAENEDNL